MSEIKHKTFIEADDLNHTKLVEEANAWAKNNKDKVKSAAFGTTFVSDKLGNPYPGKYRRSITFAYEE